MLRQVAILGLIGGLAGAAEAAAPPPQKPVDADRLLGRWYEILRTPNNQQKNCFAAYQEWARQGSNYLVRQVCHRDGAGGRENVIGAAVRPINPQNTEFEATFFGGMIHARYWLTDHDDAYDWIIATTEDGRYPKVLARQPSISWEQADMLMRRMARLGFDTARLQPVGVEGAKP
jgi:apolipoprotein D and lipocalin family protein